MDQNTLQNDSFKLFAQTWQTMLNEQLKQVEASFAQLNVAQAQVREQSSQLGEEMSRLARGQVDYALGLQAQWRDMLTEAMRSNIALLSPRKD